MNDPGDALSLPVVQDWPGTGTATVGYGSVGGLVWDRAGAPVYARQDSAPRLVGNGTRQLSDPVQPGRSFNNQGASDVYNISTFLGSIGAAGIPEEFLIAETYDTANTDSHSVVDPLVGQRIYEVDPALGTFVFADDNYVFLVDDEDNIVRTVDMCSPVLQLDRSGVVRTRRGIATIDGEGSVEYVREGSFMHASSKGSGGEEVLATSVGGTVMLFDVETNARKWRQTMSRGSMSKWSRVISLENPATALWCNRYEMALLDLRMKPQRCQKALSILDYTDRLTEIRGIDAGFERGNDLFALTSNEVLWLSATPSRAMHPVLAEKHNISSEDLSTNLYRGSYADNELITVSSQLMPMTAVCSFGRTAEDELPISTRDMYFVDAWASIISQSHITKETPQGVALYTVGRGGGLFRQALVKPDDAREGVTDLPPPDPLPAPNYDAVMHPDDQLPHKDYDLLDFYQAVKSYQLQWIYQWAFKPLTDPSLGDTQEEATDGSTGVLRATGTAADNNSGEADPADAESLFSTRDTLQDHLERAWLDPLDAKTANTDVHPEALNTRRRVISAMVDAALQASEQHVADEVLKGLLEAADDMTLGAGYAEMLEGWQVHEGRPRDADEDAWEAASQPTQMPQSMQGSQSQPMGYAGSYSQPVLGIPSLKVSKKRHGDRKSNKKKKLRR